MIKFACRCSHVFVVEDDQAGASLQCPTCGLLVDVPTLSDLPNLSPDGTYTLSEVDERHEPNRLNTLYRSFTRETVDPTTGEEFDLRLSPDEIDSAGTAEPMRLKDEPQSTRPKYDPVTGELVRPLDIVGGDDRPNAAAIPMAAPAVNYATVHTAPIPSFWTIAIELLMPANVTVMFFLSLAYLAGQFAFATIILFVLNIPIAALLLSHYGNVIEDTGPELKDELPRPLRYLALGDDIWKPFMRMLGAVLICYGPAVVTLQRGLPWEMAVVVAMVGSLFLPAVMLTMTTSGSIQNLRPDRVVGVIGILGARYFAAVGLWVTALVLHLWTWLGVLVLTEYVKMGMVGPGWSKLNHPLAVYPLIAIAIYLMHFYCWYMGILYRRHQQDFPWVLQRHIPDPTRKAATRLTPYGPVKVLPGQQRGRRGFAPNR